MRTLNKLKPNKIRMGEAIYTRHPNGAISEKRNGKLVFMHYKGERAHAAILRLFP